jgi:glutamate-ammonia-ligase adenylyltransferase
MAAVTKAGKLELPDPGDPAVGSGFLLLAVGKLRSRELNYSSDVDLIALWDPERVRPALGVEPQDLFVRVTREIVRILSQATAGGYVFRVDLRLRPDHGATPVAISLDAAETYYESVGQNWERAQHKARRQRNLRNRVSRPLSGIAGRRQTPGPTHRRYGRDLPAAPSPPASWNRRRPRN